MSKLCVLLSWLSLAAGCASLKARPISGGVTITVTTVRTQDGHCEVKIEKTSTTDQPVTSDSVTVEPNVK